MKYHQKAIDAYFNNKDARMFVKFSANSRWIELGFTEWEDTSSFKILLIDGTEIISEAKGDE